IRDRTVTGVQTCALPILFVIVGRRGDWRGRQAVFWGAVAAWPALWLIGQLGWASDEVLRSLPLPWFKWHIILQLSGSALPFIARSEERRVGKECSCRAWQ